MKLLCYAHKWLDNMDKGLNNFSDRFELMISKVIASIVWTWQQMTLLSVAIVVITLLLLATLALIIWMSIPHWRKKAKQRKWRAYLKKEAEEKVSQK